jgi:hypothetical protein
LMRQFLLDDLAICKDALFITALYIIFCNWTVSVPLQSCPLYKIKFRLTDYSHLTGLFNYRQTFN